MVKTGEEKYDRLPARMGFNDVDALRYSYIVAKKRLLEIELKLGELAIKYLRDKIK